MIASNELKKSKKPFIPQGNNANTAPELSFDGIDEILSLAKGGTIDPKKKKKAPAIQPDDQLIPSSYSKAGIADSTAMHDNGSRVFMTMRAKTKNYGLSENTNNSFSQKEPKSVSDLQDLSEDDLRKISENSYGREVSINKNFKGDDGYLGARVKEFDVDGKPKFALDEFVLRNTTPPKVVAKKPVQFYTPRGTPVKREDMGQVEKMALGGDLINAGAGVYSLVNGLNNKAPEKFKPTLYNPAIRPAQGNMEALQRQKNDIQSEATAASIDVSNLAGGDVNRAIAGRIAIQKNVTNARNTADFNNAKLYQDDLARVSGELNQKELTNNGLINEAEFNNNVQARSDYERQQNLSRTGIQSSLSYLADQSSDMESKAVRERAANNALRIEGIKAKDASDLQLTIAGKADLIDKTTDGSTKFDSYATKNYQKRRRVSFTDTFNKRSGK